MLNRILWLLALSGFIGAVVLWTDYDRAQTRTRLAAHEANVNDASAPPVLHARQRDPDWTIKYWLGVGKKSSDCAMADEMMDHNANVKTVGRRGSRRSYYLDDYISSCKGAYLKMIENTVEPQAVKWCAFRSSDPRLEELCREWLNNKDSYIAELEAGVEPTLRRYAAFLAQ